MRATDVTTQLSGMNRATIRNLWLVMTTVMLVGGYICYTYASNTRAEIDQAHLNLDAVYRELENAQRLSAALSQLDAYTINEATATRLEILRHLELEQTDYDVDIASRLERQLGNTTLYVRNIRITVALPYQALLTMIDRFHNNGRLILTSAMLEREPDSPGDAVNLTLEGMLYGLQKKVNP